MMVDVRWVLLSSSSAAEAGDADPVPQVMSCSPHVCTHTHTQAHAPTQAHARTSRACLLAALLLVVLQAEVVLRSPLRLWSYAGYNFWRHDLVLQLGSAPAVVEYYLVPSTHHFYSANEKCGGRHASNGRGPRGPVPGAGKG